MKDTEIKVNSETGEVIESENVKAAKKAAKEAVEYTNAFEAEVAKLTDKSSSNYSIDYALEQLEAVRNESYMFAEVTREKLCQIKSGGPEDIGAQAAASALQLMIDKQGDLYLKQIDFYTGMIADLKHDKRKQFLDFVVSCTEASKGPCLPDFESIWNSLENHE